MKQFAEIVNTIMRECLVLKDHTKTCINIRAHEVYPKLLKYLEDLSAGQCRALEPKVGVVVDMLHPHGISHWCHAAIRSQESWC